MKWFSNLKVSYKILLCCMVFLLIIAAISLQGVNREYSSREAFGTFYNDRFMPVRWLNRIMRNLLQIRVNMLQEMDSARKGDYREMEARFESSRKLAAEYLELWDKFTKTELNEQEKKLAAEWVEQGRVPREARAKFGTELKNRNYEEAEKHLKTWLEGFRPLRDTTDRLIVIQQEVAEQIQRDQESASVIAVRIDIIMLLAAILMGVIITEIGRASCRERV